MTPITRQSPIGAVVETAPAGPAQPRTRPPAPSAPRPGRPPTRRHLSDKTFALLLMAPAGLFLAAFVLWPLIRFVT
ncbi:MAG TPA: hypothetical protein VFE99_08685, partial [Agromyces sp.]|nr:hypothetical protein [Agromyces sp.]